MEHRAPVSDSRGQLSIPATSRTIHSSVASTTTAIASSSLTPLRFGGREAVVAAGYDGQVDVRGELVGPPERVVLALHDERGHPGADAAPRAATSRAGPAGAAGRPAPGSRPPEGASRSARPSGPRRSGRPTTSGVRVRSVGRGGGEADVEGRRRAGDLAAGHPPGLLEQQHADALPRQVPRPAPPGRGCRCPAGAVAEQEGGDRPARPVGDQAAVAVRRADALLGGHAWSLSAPARARPPTAAARSAPDRCCARC